MRMNARSPMQSYWSNSLAIRQEIQRFESVHPSIYAIYDLIEAIPDPLIQQQIREHVVCIEDSFVNSQEWTLSRSVPDLKLGILGSVQSGKSALVHRYLTGSYMQEESPEGGRFKKEVIIDGQSYLLLIRDEGGTPEMQFTHWVDAVIFVFSLENEMSFQAVHSHYAKMRQYRDTKEIPLILVGTQDAISESNPRIIDDTRARKLANDLKRCSYYETCATYGLNVERVFQDACQRIVQMRYPTTPSSVPAAVPSTPNHSQRSFYISQSSSNKPSDTHSISSHSTSSSGTLVTTHSQPPPPPPKEKDLRDSKSEKVDKKKEKPVLHPVQQNVFPASMQPPQIPSMPPPQLAPMSQLSDQLDIQALRSQLLEATRTPLAMRKNSKKFSIKKSNSFNDRPTEGKDLPTPSSTPTQSRKNRRRSNLFNPKSKEEEKKQVGDGEKVGSGRTIPLKQGYLYKKSHGLNKEWKKKYVALSDDGRLVYHSNLHDYMEDTHAKEIPLVKTTVKIPGMRPRGSRAVSTGSAANGDMNNSIAFDVSGDGQIDNSLVIPNSSITPGIPDQPRTRPERSPMLPKLGINSSSRDTPNVKKRHRRAKSGGIKNSNPGDGEDSDGYEFVIVSLENKQWHFEAQSGEERDGWVDAIEQQILSSLQANDAGKNKKQNNSDPAGIQAIRCARGNNACADCSMPSPDWASINLGALICIECSGIHRNLGTHISRVRSLDLDEWPNDIVKVMVSIGNSTANSVWEANTKGRPRPTQSSQRDEKERWIRAKYEAKEFLPPLPYIDIPVNQQLIDALVREDIRNIIVILGHAEPEDINAPYSKDDGRTALHIAAALGNVVFVQLLLWYNANVKVVDHEGRNALWYARSSGSSECTELLTTNGCPEHPTLPRRRGSVQQGKNDVFDKLPASVI
ncbi:arf-GAP with GTPase, ANK repeat and PH domain-containing protein 1-like isoform X1 [Biomphalaria glabrata]|uniref:Arf-GAP with GTPase, ANK repeat and PH domain-containing protein 1-like isoform X1 n=4 Tax=Panpulmonata TaxID=977775 RepID=A0A9W2YCL7_BIOGL|nr:arf-GAP with GTPase, ANK repeat and PH domain-containing protein 1-like isoform X1 [Biomphalaria glabrata]KAI8743373.1 arf-GAP with GTPase; ANK repeat and PH domain-containing protein 1 isoform X4 [Biomphalaria glabrata]